MWRRPYHSAEITSRATRKARVAICSRWRPPSDRLRNGASRSDTNRPTPGTTMNAALSSLPSRNNFGLGDARGLAPRDCLRGCHTGEFSRDRTNLPPHPRHSKPLAYASTRALRIAAAFSAKRMSNHGFFGETTTPRAVCAHHSVCCHSKGARLEV